MGYFFRLKKGCLANTLWDLTSYSEKDFLLNKRDLEEEPESGSNAVGKKELENIANISSGYWVLSPAFFKLTIAFKFNGKCLCCK
jgi:hypothetical protein